MNIGIILHSRTGHTYAVAKRLQQNLLACGHRVNLEKVEAANDQPTKSKAVLLTHEPAISDYQLIVFAAPVHGGRLSAVMQTYLENLPSLVNTRVCGYVTEFFPLPSMGGNQALQRMQDTLSEKGGKFESGSVINWMLPSKREQGIKRMLDQIGTLIQ